MFFSCSLQKCCFSVILLLKLVQHNYTSSFALARPPVAEGAVTARLLVPCYKTESLIVPEFHAVGNHGERSGDGEIQILGCKKAGITGVVQRPVHNENYFSSLTGSGSGYTAGELE